MRLILIFYSPGTRPQSPSETVVEVVRSWLATFMINHRCTVEDAPTHTENPIRILASQEQIDATTLSFYGHYQLAIRLIYDEPHARGICFIDPLMFRVLIDGVSFGVTREQFLARCWPPSRRNHGKPDHFIIIQHDDQRRHFMTWNLTCRPEGTLIESFDSLNTNRARHQENQGLAARIFLALQTVFDLGKDRFVYWDASPPWFRQSDGISCGLFSGWAFLCLLYDMTIPARAFDPITFRARLYDMFTVIWPYPSPLDRFVTQRDHLPVFHHVDHEFWKGCIRTKPPPFVPSTPPDMASHNGKASRFRSFAVNAYGKKWRHANPGSSFPRAADFPHHYNPVIPHPAILMPPPEPRREFRNLFPRPSSSPLHRRPNSSQSHIKSTPPLSPGLPEVSLPASVTGGSHKNLPELRWKLCDQMCVPSIISATLR